jgi:Flp pilus assembly protein TadG
MLIAGGLMNMYKKNNKGQAMVETALVLPLLVILIFGIVEFGRIFNAYLIISSVSRDGARWASVGYKGDEVRQLVNQEIVTLNKDNLKIYVSPENDRNQGGSVNVTVEYDVPLIVPVIRKIISDTNTFPIQSTTIMRIE